eukprot:scaffold5138_cov251-Pinguiococcus_pyrenoidosus.AAC.2
MQLGTLIRSVRRSEGPRRWPSGFATFCALSGPVQVRTVSGRVRAASVHICRMERFAVAMISQNKLQGKTENQLTVLS